MRIARYLMLLAAAGAVQAQVNWDNTGNGMLKGTYYFRQVYYVLADQNGDLGEAIALYGNITFDGAGNYSVSGNYVDTGASRPTGPLTATGTYSIALSGYGFMTSPYASGDYIYGLVGSNGVFVGSSTENTTYGYNDMMIAAPVPSPVPTTASFTGSWTLSDFDFSSGSPATALSMVFSLNPDGAGNLGNVIVSGYAGTSTTPITQSSSGLKYTVSSGAAVATFPNNGTLVAGQKYFYFSPDGNFLFGGAPNSFDMIVGVKTGTNSPTLSKCNSSPSNFSCAYYTAGIDEVGGDLDSFSGSFHTYAGSTKENILGHERVNDYGGSNIYDYTYSDTVNPSANGTFSSPYAKYIVSADGKTEITSGIGPYLGISVGVLSPTPTPTGVFIDPRDVVNSGSNAPFTAGIAPGELLAIYGSNLSNNPNLVVGPTPFLTSLANVQVTIGGLPAAIYYVSPAQIAAAVPYGITASTSCGCVQVQVTNNGVLSNIVTEYVSTSAPGVFAANGNGTGYGAIERADYSIVSSSNPAHIGEQIAIYLTGLGTVSPTVADGAVGSNDPNNLNNATNAFSVFFINATTGAASAAVTPAYTGLAPSLSGLYQMNVVIPTTGVTAGDNYIAIEGPDSYMQYLLLPVTAATSSAEVANVGVSEASTRPKQRKTVKGIVTPRIRKQQ